MFKNFSNTRIIGNHVIYLPKCHSTNDIAISKVKSGEYKEGQVIITDDQYAGRGQRGNSWDSEAGKNLTFSIVLCPEFLQADQSFLISIAVALGIHDGLARIIPYLTIKWPNDLYFKDKKLGGILIENILHSGNIQQSVAGIGINVNQEKFNLDKAVSIKQILGIVQDRELIFEMILDGIDNRYQMLIKNSGESLRENYLQVLYWFGERHRFRSVKEFTGTISGIDDYGRLIVNSELGLQSYEMKEIEFLD